MKALSDKARDQSAGKTAHWAAVGNIERLCKASVSLWNEKPRNGSTDILHYAKHGAAFSFGGSNYIAKITSKAYPGVDGVVTYSVEAISVENNFARVIADAISKKQHLDPSDESRILNFVEAVKGGLKPYSYIIGNPPFVGYSNQSEEQKSDMLSVYVDEKGRPYKTAGKIDYVAAWYRKACDLIQGTPTFVAFVSTNTASYVSDVSPYHFGVLTASVHMAWMRTVCGRLEMRYRYSAAIVYNNFPWPVVDSAKGILDARALYPDSSLADLYDPLTMPPELRKAHAANDAAVLKAYGWPTDLSEPEIVSRLFEMYAKLTEITD